MPTQGHSGIGNHYMDRCCCRFDIVYNVQMMYDGKANDDELVSLNRYIFVDY